MEERWHDLAVRKVARCPEEDHDMRIWNTLDAQSSAEGILRTPLRSRLSCLAAEPQFTNCCVSLSGRLRTHSDFTEWPPN